LTPVPTCPTDARGENKHPAGTVRSRLSVFDHILIIRSDFGRIVAGCPRAGAPRIGLNSWGGEPALSEVEWVSPLRPGNAECPVSRSFRHNRKAVVILSEGRRGDRSRKICGCFSVFAQTRHCILSGLSVIRPELVNLKISLPGVFNRRIADSSTGKCNWVPGNHSNVAKKGQTAQLIAGHDISIELRKA
jgi:hypothetical protein